MAEKSNDSLINRLRIFSRGLPSANIILLELFVLSLFAGLLSVVIINYNKLTSEASFIAASGVLAGILTVFLPTLLTVVVIKYLKRYIRVKHLLFLAMIGAFVYSLFLIIASLAYILTGDYSLSTAIVLIGDASIFGWWFFLSKIVFAQRKKASLFALVQPMFNILLYISSSRFIFTFSSLSLKLIFLKLYAGIFIFLIISYIILYVLDGPMKKSLGFDAIEMFSGFVQNWLFDMDMGMTERFRGKMLGIKSDVEAQSIVFVKRGGTIKAILFAPWIHYGPMGTLGGSNFPYLLERYAVGKYKAPTFVMHCTVDEGSNPISSSQLNTLKRALDECVSKGRKTAERNRDAMYSKVLSGESTVYTIEMDRVRLVTLTRAPLITEDIHPEASRLFVELLKQRGKDTVLLDAHNSRYESAPQEDLYGVGLNSKAMNDYISAIEKRQKPQHHGRDLRVGVCYVEAYEKLGKPFDLAPGNLNFILLAMGRFRFAMIQANANNMMPGLRDAIVKHVKSKYGIDAEVYTTDTHFVNSLQRTASNVLGRYTSHEALIALVDKAAQGAISNLEPVGVGHGKMVMKNFYVWGPNVRERVFPVIASVMGLARTIVPIIVVAGFIIGAWIISYI